MPFAQWGYPRTGVEEFESSYPAQFICEAIDQTRGWFYTLMAVGTLVFDRSSYENVVCLGHILAEDGRKMSKHLGNILEPIPLMDAHGADAVRWFMAAGGSPWQSRRVGHATIQEVVRKTLLTYWNTVSFQSLYAQGRAAGTRARRRRPPVAERPALDRWALSEAHRLAREVDAALEAFDTQRAGRLLSGYVDDLSNWYVRRSRRRFWDGDPAALATLHECLDVVTLLMAPLVPFVTERVWQDLFAATSDELPDSVHLAAWPVVDGVAGRRPPRRAGGAGTPARRARPGHPRRLGGQDPPAAVPGPGRGAAGWAELPAELREQIAEELNVERRSSALRRTRRRRQCRAGSSTSRPRATSARWAPVRPAHPSGRGRHRGGRRARPGGGAARRPARRPSRSTASRSRSPTTRSSSPRPRARAGRSAPTAARRSRSTSRSRRELRLAGPGPRRRPHAAGGAQERRLRGDRPDRRAVGRLRRGRRRRCTSTAGRWPRRCWRPRSRRGLPRPDPARRPYVTGHDAETGLELRAQARPALKGSVHRRRYR